jgi:hypothetical protein
MVQFRAGYGGPITVSIAAGSAALTVTGGSLTSFNADDAPLMAGDTGLSISIPAAGADGETLVTHIASVDPATGQATLADAAVTAVSRVQGWVGKPIPEEFRNAIKLMTEYYYGVKQSELNEDLKTAAEAELAAYRNFVS